MVFGISGGRSVASGQAWSGGWLLPASPEPRVPAWKGLAPSLLASSRLVEGAPPAPARAAGSSPGLSPLQSFSVFTTSLDSPPFPPPFFHTSVGRLVGFQDSWERCQPPSAQVLFKSGTWALAWHGCEIVVGLGLWEGCSHPLWDLISTAPKYQGRAELACTGALSGKIKSSEESWKIMKTRDSLLLGWVIKVRHLLPICPTLSRLSLLSGDPLA